ncbi:MAG: DNA-processing protein DprA [Actinomycetes bacterium]
MTGSDATEGRVARSDSAAAVRAEGSAMARLVLSQATEPGDTKVGEAVHDWGPELVLDRLDAGHGESIGLGHLAARWQSGQHHDAAERELDRAGQLAVRFVLPGSPDWPTQLDDLGSRSPLMLRVLGAASLRPAAARSVAIVGARAATRYGEAVAEDLASELAHLGWAVVSGGAFGIDAAAHRGALVAAGVSVAVSAAGVDRPAPVANTSLFMRLYDTGAVVSEMPIGAPPSRSRFLVRNRVIAALARCVVVVEAAKRSGARATAREATNLGRVVAAVPGPVTSAMSAGCHEMIRDEHAVLVGCAEQVVELLVTGCAGPATLPVSADEQLVLDLLSVEHPRSADSVATGAELDVARAVSLLLLLESRGLARRDREGWSGSNRSGASVGAPGPARHTAELQSAPAEQTEFLRLGP